MVCFIPKTTFYLKTLLKWNECSPMFTMLRRSCGVAHSVWEGIVVINTTEELRIPTQYVNRECNLISFI